MIVPLRSRGRDDRHDAAHRHRTARTRAEDREFAQLIGGRVALALENAGLFAERVETRLTTALDSLAEAVTIQDADGALDLRQRPPPRRARLRHAAGAAATPPQAHRRRLRVLQRGRPPLELDQLPGRAVLRGETPEPLVVRAIRRDTGEERWRVVKATPVDAAGSRST